MIVLGLSLRFYKFLRSFQQKKLFSFILKFDKLTIQSRSTILEKQSSVENKTSFDLELINFENQRL